MELSRFGATIQELGAESLACGYPVAFTITGDSMRYLVRAGDKVVIKKTLPEEIRVGDIVVWDSSGALSAHPVVHRVVRRKKTGPRYSFLTKGDFNGKPDPAWATEDRIIGKVVSIEKRGRLIRVDRGGGKLLSRLYCLFTMLSAGVRKTCVVLRHGAALIGPEAECRCGRDGALFAQSLAIPPDAWDKSVRTGDAFIDESRGTDGIVVGDVGPGGFSAEAMRLLRRGYRVVNCSPFEAPPDTPAPLFTYVLVARVVDIFTGKPQRAAMFRRISGQLERGGKMYLSVIDPGNNTGKDGVLRMKRRFYRKFLGDAYRGPDEWDVIVDGHKKRAVTIEEIRDELREIPGFEIEQCFQNERVGTLVATRI
jgi:signal peptidase I